MNPRQDFQWSSCGLTDVGKVRTVNEDAFLDHPSAGLWVVADGMGGHAAGDLASRMIVETLGALPPPARLSLFVNRIEDSLLDVNRQLLQLSSEQLNHQIVGSTVVGMIGYGRYCIFFWVGDSRLYRLRGDNLSQLNRDHTEVEELVQQGLLLRENMENHPDKNTITRAIGADPQLLLEFDLQEVQDRDLFLLCSDGLDKEVSEPEIREILLGNGQTEATHKLLELTLTRGARDNVTIITVLAQATA